MQQYIVVTLYDDICKNLSMKKMIKIILLVITVLLSSNDSVFAETIYTEGALNYVIRDGSIVIVGYFGVDKEVVVPDHIGTYVVTGIASKALVKDCIEKVILPETVISVEEGAIKEHTVAVVEDSYGNTISEDISDIKVEEDFFIDSEEYDKLSDLENTDDDVFVDEDEEVKEEEEIESNDEFEEIYSAKTSAETKNTNYYPIIICGVAIVVGVCLIVRKKIND